MEDGIGEDGIGEAPSDVEVDRSRAVMTLTWRDGAVSRYAFADLRAACPCASCRNQRESGHAVLAPASISVAGAELVGHWGLQVRWSDGHGTGIYTWALLRSWAATPPPTR